MNLNEEQIKEVQEMAELFYSPEDIALNIEVDQDKFRAQLHIENSQAAMAYKRGWLGGDMKLRQGIAQAAANGSNPAQQMMREIQQQNKISL